MAELELPDTFSFDFTITSASPAGLITVVTLPTTESLYPGIEQTYYVSTKTVLEDLQATLNLASKPVATSPNIFPEDTQAERQAKIADIQTRFAKMGMAIHTDNGSGWRRKALPLVQNFGRETYLPILQPYVTTKPVYLLSKAAKFAIELTNLGADLLGAGDSINISGCYEQLRCCVPRVVGVYHSVGVIRDAEQQ
jgi:hypothetical protein